MIRIKICGITTEEDALFAASLGAWALGLNFAEGSPRCLTLERAAEIADVIPRRVRRVGVFVNAERRFIENAARHCSLDVVQLHGDEPPEACLGWGGCEVIKALPLRMAEDAAALKNFHVFYHLVDSRGDGRYGGTGKTVDWSLAARAASTFRLILAGGLTPENVSEAVRRVRPFAVDVASGVESSPGIKDPYKMEKFFRAARAASEEVVG